MASRKVTARIEWDGVKKFTKNIKVAGKQIELSFDKGKVKVREFEQKANGAAARMKANFAKVSKILGPLGLGAGIAGAVFGMKRLITNTIKYRDEVGKAAKATGLTVEFLSQMDFAAERSGTSLQGLQVGLRGLLRNMQGVKDKSLESVRAFDQLGVKVLQNNGELRRAEDVFFDVADAIKRHRNETEAAALAQQVFGRSGIALVPLLREGKDGLQKLAKESDDFGKTLNTKMTQQAEDAADALTNFNTAIGALGQALAAGTLDSVTGLANNLAAIVSNINKLSESRLGRFLASLGNTELGAAEEAARNLERLQRMGPPPLPLVEIPSDIELPVPDDADIADLDEFFGAFVIGFEKVRTAEAMLGEQAFRRKLEFIDINELTQKGFEKMRAFETAEQDALFKAQNITSQFSSIVFQIQAAAAAGRSFSAILGQIASQLAVQAGLGLLTGGISSLLGGGFLKGFKSVFGFQHGGRPPVGVPSFVGERGPELFIPDRSGTIINNRNTERIIERSNTRNINLQINAPNLTNFNETAVKNQLIPIINRLVRDGSFVMASSLK